MYTRATSLITIGLLSCLSPSAFGTEYVFETIEFPGADFTVPQDINNAGLVVGLYQTESGGLFDTFGFVWDGSDFVVPDYGLLDTAFSGISESGLIVGVGFDLETFATPVFTVPFPGDLGDLEVIDIPDAFFPLSGGINDSRQFVGSFINLTDEFLSFMRIGDELELLTLPGYSDISAADINNRGQIVGGALNDAFEGVGYILQGDDLTILNHPDGETELLAINNVGAIAGVVYDENSSRTFIYDGTTFEDFAFPGADDTVIWGMNDQGVVVGQYFLGDSEVGFIARPVPEPSAALLLLVGSILALRGRRWW